MEPWMRDVLVVCASLYVAIGVLLCLTCIWLMMGDSQVSRTQRVLWPLSLVVFWLPCAVWGIVVYFFEDYFPGD